MRKPPEYKRVLSKTPGWVLDETLEYKRILTPKVRSRENPLLYREVLCRTPEWILVSTLRRWKGSGYNPHRWFCVGLGIIFKNSDTSTNTSTLKVKQIPMEWNIILRRTLEAIGCDQNPNLFKF